jgi:tetratricopeptide (TPR) repeat protein
MNRGKRITIFFLLLISIYVHAQDQNVLLKEASNLEKQLKEPEALEKYKQIASIDTTNIAILVKCTELNCSIGARQTGKNAKTNYYNQAQTYAQKALIADANNADVNYAMAVVAGKMTEIEPEKKQVTEYVRQTKLYGDKALAINPDHAKANYVVGKWHYEMVTLSWIKKAAVKTLYGGLPKGDIDSAIVYMEKCKALDQYFVRNYLDLAKAYQYKSQPAKAIEVLNKLVKLPNRTADDAVLKEEGKQMLQQML